MRVLAQGRVPGVGFVCWFVLVAVNLRDETVAAIRITSVLASTLSYLCSYGLYSYGMTADFASTMPYLCSYGLYSYGVYRHGVTSVLASTMSYLRHVPTRQHGLCRLDHRPRRFSLCMYHFHFRI